MGLYYVARAWATTSLKNPHQIEIDAAGDVPNMTRTEKQ